VLIENLVMSMSSLPIGGVWSLAVPDPRKLNFSFEIVYSGVFGVVGLLAVL